MRTTLLLLFALALHAGSDAEAYNVLGLFFHPGRSHVEMFLPLMRGLAEKGHNVTVVSHFRDKEAPASLRHLQLDDMAMPNDAIDLKMFSNRPSYKHFLEFLFLHDWGRGICETGLNSSATRQILLERNHWDLIVLEEFNTDCALGVAHLLGAPFIALSSCALMPWHYGRMGNPLLPSYVPSLFLPYSDDMSLLERVHNWITQHTFSIGFQLLYSRTTDEQFERYLGPGIPASVELAKRTSLIFVNQHFSLSGPKPLSRSVIEVGGIHIKPQKPLDEDISQIIDGADHGVILLSWGSMIRAETLPDDKREELLHALGQLKQRVLWKWENVTMPNKPPNVYIRRWLPQRDLLCHPKVRVFMSHGGLLGSTEAAHCGTPMVVTPMYGDQFMNAAALVHRGMGVLLEYEDIDRDTVLAALRKALEPSMAKAAKTVSYSFRNRPQTPLETAIWWAEYVAATGGASLTKSSAVDLPWYIYYSLDVYALLLSCLAVVFLFLRQIWLLTCGGGSPTKTPTEAHKKPKDD